MEGGGSTHYLWTLYDHTKEYLNYQLKLDSLFENPENAPDN